MKISYLYRKSPEVLTKHYDSRLTKENGWILHCHYVTEVERISVACTHFEMYKQCSQYVAVTMEGQLFLNKSNIQSWVQQSP